MLTDLLFFAERKLLTLQFGERQQLGECQRKCDMWTKPVFPKHGLSNKQKKTKIEVKYTLSAFLFFFSFSFFLY